MTRASFGKVALVAGAACFVLGGLAVILGAAGVATPLPEMNTALAVIGMVLVGAGASMQGRSGDPR